jgi:hypothetical protein
VTTAPRSSAGVAASRPLVLFVTFVRIASPRAADDSLSTERELRLTRPLPPAAFWPAAVG